MQHSSSERPLQRWGSPARHRRRPPSRRRRRSAAAGGRSVAVVGEEGHFGGLVPPTRLLSLLELEHEEALARLGGFRSRARVARTAATTKQEEAPPSLDAPRPRRDASAVEEPSRRTAIASHLSADPPIAAWPLTRAGLTRATGASEERIRQLTEIGVLYPRPQEPAFLSSDILRVRAVEALEASGVAVDEIGEAIGAGHLSLRYLDYVAQPPPLRRETHAELCEELGLPFETIERVYLAFGLPQPAPDELVREDDVPIHRGLTLLLAALEESDLLHSARLFGDSMRRIAEYQVHLFHTKTEQRFRQAGVSEELVLDVALREVGVHSGPLGEQLASWLYRRHSETFAVAHRVLHGEADLERAGIRRKAADDPAAILFLDISGYTRLTEELGDEASAELPMRLGILVQEAAGRHHGRTVKWIGDGVELYFRDPADAVRCALELRDLIASAGLPETHVGINAGPVVYENGDFYGRTVNVAARIANHASSGQVLASAEVAGRGAIPGIRFTNLGAVAFKGVRDEVVVYDVARE